MKSKVMKKYMVTLDESEKDQLLQTLIELTESYVSAHDEYVCITDFYNERPALYTFMELLGY